VSSIRSTSRRVAVLACAAVLPLGLSACGNKQDHPVHVDNEAEYVDAGPLAYQVQISRELNPFSAEDHTYLSGVTSSDLPLAPNQVWFAIFLWAKNETDVAHTTADHFDIIDTQGNRYYPVAINAQSNPFAWTAEKLKPNQTQPIADSAASFGPTQGQEILFKLKDSVYDNRPLTFEIFGPGESSPSTVVLDL
jgi:hypothetical protein